MCGEDKHPVELEGTAPVGNDTLAAEMQTNLEKLKNDFGHSGDLIVTVTKHDKSRHAYTAVYINKLSDDAVVNAISRDLSGFECDKRMKPEAYMSVLMNRVAAGREIRNGGNYASLYRDILDGNIAFLIDGSTRYFALVSGSSEGRSITEPTSQTIIKGPKDAFTEDISKNVYQIRKRIRNEALRIEDYVLGTVTYTKVKLLFINGLPKGDIIADVRERLVNIKYDGILDSGYIEELFKTNKYSLFPTSLNSERPDVVTGALLEGRLAIFVDGTPYAITVPALFTDFIQSSEDYYYSYIAASFLRILRYIALFLTLFVPAIIVALTTFHQEIIPTPLLISIAAQREGVPFPAFIEVFIMEISFEIIREAGIRMPRAIGPAISIVGALVLGQAAVEAGLISALVVISVAITAIASFAITNYSMSNAVRLIRFLFILLAGVLGLYGISVGIIILTLHLAKIKSAGVPYLSPFAPRIKGQNRDTFLRFPLWALKKRPVFTSSATTEKTPGKQDVSGSVKGKPEIR